MLTALDLLGHSTGTLLWETWTCFLVVLINVVLHHCFGTVMCVTGGEWAHIEGPAHAVTLQLSVHLLRIRQPAGHLAVRGIIDRMHFQRHR